MNQKSRILVFIFLLSGLALGVGGAVGGQAAPNSPTANAGWEEVGVGSASGGGIHDEYGSGWSNFSALAIAPDGTPYIAWSQYRNGQEEIFVRSWNGTSWAEVGSGSASDGGISNTSTRSFNPSIAVGLDGAPVVAWGDAGSDTDGHDEIYVRRWNGTAWVEMDGSASVGGISDTAGSSWDPSVAIADGKPIVAWSEWIDDNNTEIYVRRWDGNAWVEMGAGSASGDGISHSNLSSSAKPSLAVTPAGTPILAWNEGLNVYLLRWDGAAWVEMGGSASGGGISDIVTNGHFSNNNFLAIGPGGNPIVAWEFDDGISNNIHLRYWNNSDWVELGGSATGEGIGAGILPVVAIAPNGSPIVVWLDISISDTEIYARLWNGSDWVEFDSGSASGDGISDDDESSDYPSLAVAADNRAFAAWDVSTGFDDLKIYVRRSPPIPALCPTLTLSHTGQGSDPSANPPNSDGCAVGQYTAGQAVSLTARPAPGWSVAGWSGTDNDSSTSTTNTVTMPAAEHTVSVSYVAIPPPTDWAYTPLVLHQPPPPCFAGPNEIEPNSSATSANGPLCPGVVFRGLPDDLWDMYYLQTTRAGDITVTLTDLFSDGMQLSLYTGTVGGSPYQQDTEDSDGLHVALPGPQPGRYYVVVYTATPNPAETRPYRLSLSFP